MANELVHGLELVDFKLETFYGENFSELLEKARLDMACVCDSSPGYPFSKTNNTNAYWLNKEWQYTKSVCLQIIDELPRLAATAAGERGDMESFVQVFVKNEPLSRKKLIEKRPRVIMGTSIVMQLVSRVLYANFLAASSAAWKDMPVCTGMGMSTPEQVRLMFDMLKGFDTSDDIKAWDWSMQHWLYAATLEVNLLVLAHFGASPLHLELYTAMMVVLASPVLVFSDGMIVVLDECGQVASGRLDTADFNSKAKGQLSKLVHRSPKLPTKNMGDDGLAKGGRLTSEQLEERYKSFGYTLSLAYTFCTDRIEFCSHLFDYCENKVVFLNSAKAVANYVSKANPNPGQLLESVALSPIYDKIFDVLVGEGAEIPQVHLQNAGAVQRWAGREEYSVPHAFSNDMGPNSKHDHKAKSGGKLKPKARKQLALPAPAKSGDGKERRERKVESANLRRQQALRAAYLRAYLSPTTQAGVKIPDEDTRPSSTFTTRKIIQVRARPTASGLPSPAFEIVALGPNLYNAVIQPGVNVGPTHWLTLMMTGQPDLSTFSTGASVDQIMDTEMLSSIREVYSDLRVVTAEMAWTNTRNALETDGICYYGSFGRGQWIAEIDDPTNNGFATSDSFCYVLGSQSNGYNTFENFCASCDYQAPSTESVAVRWIAQDQENRDYSPVPIGSDSLNPAGPIWGPNPRQATQVKDNAFYLLTDVLNEHLIDDYNSYLCPCDYTATSNINAPATFNMEETRPPLNNWVGFAIQTNNPAAPGALLGELVITTQWEGIPRKAAGTIVSATPSVSDPMALALAANASAALPSVYNYTRPSAPENQPIRAMAQKVGLGSVLNTVAEAAKAIAPVATFIAAL